MFLSVRLRLTAWYALILAATVAALGVTVYLYVESNLDRDIDRSITTATETLVALEPAQLLATTPGDTRQLVLSAQPAGTASQLPSTGGDSDDDGENDDDKDGEGDEDHRDDDDASPTPAPTVGPPSTVIATDVFFLVADSAGSLIANPRNIDADDLPLRDMSGQPAVERGLRDIHTDHGHFRFATAPLGDDRWLHVGRSLESRDNQLRTLSTVLAAGGGAGLVFAFLGGLFVSGRALVPIRRSFDTQRQFVSDASHEMRTPIAVIRANAELAMGHPEESVQERSRELESILNETRHLGQMVERLLTLARADEGSVNLRLEPTDVGALTAVVAGDMEAIASNSGITLLCESAPVRLAADPDRIREMLVILIDNAIRHTGKGGTITVRSAAVGNSAVLSVSDTGEGIPPEHLGRIFDRFYRVDRARARERGSAGLGLSIAKWIAEAHGGRITVESAVGRGTTFTIRLPRGH
jgi:signal transduction histidine kinase